MATSVYFNNQNAKNEQMLLEDLIIESIKNHGIDVYYLPRQSQSSEDELFGDDPVKAYYDAIKIEMYLETFQDYEGNKEFFGKFGIEIQETARLCMARRTYEKYVMRLFPDNHVPKEGDLIYLPVQYKLMEIKFVEEEKNFFQFGRDSKNPYMYAITLEAFKYNGELFDTGVSEIDRIGDVQAVNIQLDLNGGEPAGEFGPGIGTFEKHESIYQGESYETATAKGIVSDWNATTGALKIRNYFGAFVPNEDVIGVKSGAVWNLTASPDTLKNVNYESIEDNSRIEAEASGIIDFTEINPFGSP